MDKGGMVADGSAAPDPTDSVDRFVTDLRRLRDALDRPPTWDAMVRRAKKHGVTVSRGTLHSIASTDRLPSELAVRGYVSALIDDLALIAGWLDRRSALTAPPTDLGDPTPPAPPTHRRHRVRWWVTGAAALLVTNAVTALIVRNASAPAPQITTAPHVATGDDPGRTPCVDDAKIATSTNKNPQLLLEILFSVKCQAGWARITRYDDKSLGNRVDVSIYRRSDPDGDTRQDATEPDVQSAYTFLIVRTDGTDRLCATGAIVTNGSPSTTVEPICT